MSRYHSAESVTWPYLCVGCGSKESLFDYKFDWGSTYAHAGAIATVDTVVRVHLCPECYEAAREKINAGRVRYSKAARASRKLIIPLLLLWFLVPFAILQLWNLLSVGPVGPMPFPLDYLVFPPLLTIFYAVMGMSSAVIILTILRGTHAKLEANPYYTYMELMQWAASLEVTLKNRKYYEELTSLNPSLRVEYDPDYEWNTVVLLLVNRGSWLAMLLPIGIGSIALLLFLPSFLIPWLIPVGYFSSFILLALLSFKAPAWVATPDIEAEVHRPRSADQIDGFGEKEEFVAPSSPIRAECPTCKNEAVFHPIEFLPNGKVKCKTCLELFKPEALPI